MGLLTVVQRLIWVWAIGILLDIMPLAETVKIPLIKELDIVCGIEGMDSEFRGTWLVQNILPGLFVAREQGSKVLRVAFHDVLDHFLHMVGKAGNPSNVLKHPLENILLIKNRDSVNHLGNLCRNRNFVCVLI